MMNLWEKLYFRVQSIFVFLQKKKLANSLGLAKSEYRIDLMKTLYSLYGSGCQSDLLIDIGANKGEFSEIFIDTFHPAKVICIEPNLELSSFIAMRVSGTDCAIIHKGISDHEAHMPFYFHPDSQMSSLFKSNAEILSIEFQEDNAEKIIEKLIPVTTLDLLFKEEIIKANDWKIFLKIDTQGNELDVLRGGAQALKSIAYILIEYMFHTPYLQKYSFVDLISVLSDSGFECHGPMHTSYRAAGQAGAVLLLFKRKNLGS
jgi:FkbM family methyltransferase